MSASRAQPEDIAAVRIARRRRRSAARLRHGGGGKPGRRCRASRHGVTRAIVNGDLQPTAAFVMNGDVDFEARRHAARARERGRRRAISISSTPPASPPRSLATHRHQPRSCSASPSRRAGAARPRGDRSARSSSTASPSRSNKRTFAWGRLAAHDMRRVEARGARASGAKPERRRKSSTSSSPAARPSSPTIRTPPMPRAIASLSPRSTQAEKRALRGSADLTEAVRREPLQAHGLQGRVRGGAALYRRRVPEKLQPAVRRRLPLEFHLAPPLLARARSRDRRLAEARLRRVDVAGLPPAGAPEAPARHGVRSVRTYERPHGRAPAHRRLRDGDHAIIAGLRADRIARSRVSPAFRK